MIEKVRINPDVVHDKAPHTSACRREYSREIAMILNNIKYTHSHIQNTFVESVHLKYFLLHLHVFYHPSFLVDDQRRNALRNIYNRTLILIYNQILYGLSSMWINWRMWKKIKVQQIIINVKDLLLWQSVERNGHYIVTCMLMKEQ